MKRTRLLQVFFLLTVVLTLTTAQSVERAAFSTDTDQPVFDVEAYGSEWITGDSSGNGRIDYALRLNDRGDKRMEANDFNGDGLMDDFYYYQNGVLHRQELDTNFDGVVDLWIFMHDGVRVAGYERDSDYDGVIDVEKAFGEN